MSLVNLLGRVADSRDVRDRNQAARELFGLVQQFGLPYLARKYPRVPEDIRREAVQHCLLQASVGGARFRGQVDRVAYSWCYLVLSNFVLSYLRRATREPVFLDVPDSDCVPAELVQPTFEACQISESDLYAALRVLFSEAHMLVSRDADWEAMHRNLCCYLGQRVGASIEEQIAEFGFPDRPRKTAPNDVPSLRKARDRVYQYRHRGAETVRAVLESLLRQRRMSDEPERGLHRVPTRVFELLAHTLVDTPLKEVTLPRGGSEHSG